EMWIVDGAAWIDDAPAAGRAIDEVELAAERDHDDAPVVGDIGVDYAARRGARPLAPRLFFVGEVLLTGTEQAGGGRERLDGAGAAVELVEVGGEITRRRAPEQDGAVAGDRQRGGEAEAEVEGRAGIGEELSIERWPGHGLG